MAEYLMNFNTYADYSGATYPLPNVSVITSTEEVYYKKYKGSYLGDVLMYDNVANKLVATTGETWTSTKYPTSRYEPIAVNVYPGNETPDGKSRWLSVKWGVLSNETGADSVTSSNLIYQSPCDFHHIVDSLTEFNGRELTNLGIAAMPGTSGNSQAEYPIYYVASKFHTSGTSAGDWYIPSWAEMTKYGSVDYYSTIDNVFKSINNASSLDSNSFACYLSTRVKRSYGEEEYAYGNSYINKNLNYTGSHLSGEGDCHSQGTVKLMLAL